MSESERKIFRERRVSDSGNEIEREISSGNIPCDFRPLKNNSTSFHSEQFIFHPDSITVKPTKAVKILSNVFLTLALVIAGVSLAAGEIIPALVMGIFFTFMSWVIRVSCCRNHVEIDLKNKYFYPNGKKPGKKYIAPIPLAHADFLYLLKKECRGNKGHTYSCYELNISIKSGDRYNLLCHGSKKEMLKDAEKLASILNLPLERSGGTSVPASASRRTKKSDSTVLIIVGSIFLFTGCCASYSLCIRPLYYFSKSQNWERTPAIIQQSYVHSYRGSKGKRNYSLKISYSYRYKGDQYKSDVYDFFADNSNSPGKFRKITREYPVGRLVFCYVNPDDPDQAVINRTFSTGDVFPLIFVHIFPAAGIFLLIMGIRKKKKQETE